MSLNLCKKVLNQISFFQSVYFLFIIDCGSTGRKEKTEQEVLKVAIFIILKLCTGNQRHQSANWYKDQVFLQLAC